MPCAEESRLQAWFDSELDAPTAFQVRLHAQGCAECRATLQELAALRTALHGLPKAHASSVLHARILASLEAAATPGQPHSGESGRWRTRSFWAGAMAGLGASAVAAAAAFMFLTAEFNRSVVDDLLVAHLRSFEPAHLIGVASTDRHTVKPWFAGRADVSPAVADYAAQGYRLLGGRVDPVGRQRAAVLVYQHGAHVINVFSWADDWRPAPRDMTRNGYHLAFWKVGNLQYCAVSDMGWDEMTRLTQLLRDLAVEDDRG